jgi:hypothetical protein
LRGKFLEEAEQQVFADNIDRIDRVAGILPAHLGEFAGPLAFRTGDHGIPDGVMQLAQRFQENGGVCHPRYPL